MASIGFIPVPASRAVIAKATCVAVGAFSVVAAIQAFSAALIVSVDVQAEVIVVDFFIINTLFRVAVAIAG